MDKAARPALLGICVVLVLASIACSQQGKAREDGQSRQARVDLSPTEANDRVIYRVPPEYPDNARRGHIEGPVTLHIIVNGEGSVEEMRPLQGNPFLLMSAMKAVKQWRYRPYVVNGVHVEFASSVTLKFAL